VLSRPGVQAGATRHEHVPDASPQGTQGCNVDRMPSSVVVVTAPLESRFHAFRPDAGVRSCPESPSSQEVDKKPKWLI